MASKDIEYGGKIYSLNYEILNINRSESIVFLHGWGANKEIMKKAFGGHFSEFKHIYIDMPGFGASNMHAPLHTKDYCEIVKLFLKNLDVKPEIAVGHSFGGKVATMLEPKNLVLLSSAGIVVKKPLFIRFKIMIFKFLKFLGFGFLYKFFATKDVKGMSKEMYETLKNVVDEDFTDIFAAFNGKAFIFWGESDSATPLKSGEKISRLIKDSRFYPLKGDHFFFLFHAPYIENEVISSLAKQN